MEVTFAAKRLKDCYLNPGLAVRVFGLPLAKRYVERINLMRFTPNMHELRKLPGLRCHPLKGLREGQWAINLDRFNRLIFRVMDNRMEVIRIEEVSKHYGD